MKRAKQRAREDTHGATTRRHFLAHALAGSAALAAGVGCTRSQPDQENTARAPKRTLGVALLGLGHYSKSQLGPALKQTRYCPLRGIVTGSPDKIPTWQQEYGIPDGNVYDYESLPRIAENRDIDVVYVVTPTALHKKYAVMAAEAGKHVWCEKPMAMNVAECRAIIDACRQNDVVLSIGYRLQHEPNTQTIMQWAMTNPYGPLRSLRAVVGDYSAGEDTWRMEREMGGGALYDMGVYSINAIRYASGEEPVRVLRARQWTDRPDLFREVDEHTEFELELPSGVTAYGKASRGEKLNELRVECARGWYELSPFQTYEGVEGRTSDGRKLDKQIDDQQATQMDDDALAILEQRPPLVPGEEGLRDIRIVQAIMESAASGRPVDI